MPNILNYEITPFRYIIIYAVVLHNTDVFILLKKINTNYYYIII